MSKKSCIEFVEKLKQDSGIQSMLRGASSREQFEDLLVEAGKDNGYEFTVEEAAEVLVDVLEPALDPAGIAEDELESVAGGARSQPETGSKCDLTTCPLTTLTIPPRITSRCTVTVGC